MVYTYHVIMLHSQRLASERASATDYRVMPEVKGGQQQGSEEQWELCGLAALMTTRRHCQIGAHDRHRAAPRKRCQLVTLSSAHPACMPANLSCSRDPGAGEAGESGRRPPATRALHEHAPVSIDRECRCLIGECTPDHKLPTLGLPRLLRAHFRVGAACVHPHAPPTTQPCCAPEILTTYCVDILVTPMLSAGLGRSDASSTQPTAAGPGRRASRPDSQSHRTHQSARTLPTAVPTPI
jgi:hypothetical protein